MAACNKNKMRIAVISPIQHRTNAWILLQARMSTVMPENTVWLAADQSGDDLPFNRGALLNVAFDAAVNMWPDVTHVLVHDACVYPNGKCRASWKRAYEPILKSACAPGIVHHLFGFAASLGGVWMTDVDSYRRMGGHPNHYWGWGAEDYNMLARMRAAGIQRRIPHGVTHRQDASSHVTAIRFGTDMFRRCGSCPVADRRHAFKNNMRLKRDLAMSGNALRSTGINGSPFRARGITLYADGKAAVVGACTATSAVIEQTRQVHRAHQAQKKHKMSAKLGTCPLCPATRATDDAPKPPTPRAPLTPPDITIKAASAKSASSCPCKAKGNCYTQRGPLSMTITTGILLILALGVLGSIAGMSAYLYRKRST